MYTFRSMFKRTIIIHARQAHNIDQDQAETWAIEGAPTTDVDFRKVFIQGPF